MGRIDSHEPIQALQALLRRLARDVRGNAMPLLAAALVPLLAMIGGGIDMGRSYMAQSRLQQACDAGVLATRKKIGSTLIADGVIPADAQAIGDSFFSLNFRAGAYGTDGRDFDMTLEDDMSVSGVAIASVPTSIMKAFGYDDVDLRVNCTARLNFSDADVMMVLDTTGSMAQINPSDTVTRIEALREVVKDFHAQMEAQKGPGTRIRYGFVPYAHNVNVGGLLKSDWMVGSWTYQSRLAKPQGTVGGSSGEGWVQVNYAIVAGTKVDSAPYNSPNCPSDTDDEVVSYTSPENPGPPRTYYQETVENGIDYDCAYSDGRYTVEATTYTNYTRRRTYEWQSYTYNGYTAYLYDYKPITHNVSVVKNADGNQPTNVWAQITANTYYNDNDAATGDDLSAYYYEGCIEERSTYHITDYTNVDLTRALDLDLDLVPDPANPDTQWRPMFRGLTFARELDWYGNGDFTVAEVLDSDDDYLVPDWLFDDQDCPAPSRKLAEISASDLESYLESLEPAGATYHDIGMIWGGRLISSTGIFSAENADQPGRSTSRHMIFLTDGETAPRDFLYTSYGIEGLDGRRLDANDMGLLTQTVEDRFSFACEEVKKKNVTVWVVGFGTKMTDMLKECAGPGRWFQADDAAQLSAAFQAIATSMGDLRISK